MKNNKGSEREHLNHLPRWRLSDGQGGVPPLHLNDAPGAVFDTAGNLLYRFGGLHSGSCVVNLLAEQGDELSSSLAAREAYVVATLAQAVLEVAQGMHPTVEKRCPCASSGATGRCLVRVEPHYADKVLVGARISCQPDPGSGSGAAASALPQ